MFCYNKIKLANCTRLPVFVLYSCDLRQATVLLHTEHLGFLALSKGLTNQFAIQTDATAAIGEPEQSHKAHNMAASNSKDHTHDPSIIACSHHLYMGAILCPHPICGESCIQRHAKKWQQTMHCKIFAQTGFLLEKVQSKLMISHLQQLLHYIGI